MNIFKLFTQSGRRDLVAQAFDEAVTVDKITNLTATSCTELLAKIKTDVSIQSSVTIACYVAKGNDIFQAVVQAAEDKVITEEEAAKIISDILGIFGATLEDTIKAVRAAIIARIP